MAGDFFAQSHITVMCPDPRLSIFGRRLVPRSGTPPLTAIIVYNETELAVS